MAFTVNDVRDLIRLLAEHPEWRDELRPLILGDEFNRMPAAMQSIAEHQAATSEALASLSVRMDQLTERMDQLTEALTLFRQETSARFDRVELRLGTVEGRLVEVRFEQRAPSYFGLWLQRPRVVELDEVGVDEAVESGVITSDEYEALGHLDLLVRGGDKREPGRPQTVFAVEVSNTIDVEDVVRAAERAAILKRAGIRARGSVGGAALTGRADELARERDVAVRLVAG